MGEKEYWCKQLNKGEVMHMSRLKRSYSANKINNRSNRQSVHIADPVIMPEIQLHS